MAAKKKNNTPRRASPATRAKKAKRKAKGSPRTKLTPKTDKTRANANGPRVELVGPSGTVATVQGDSDVATLAARWMYVLRNRSRWVQDMDLREAQRERVVEDLGQLGVNAGVLEQLASTRVLEVTFYVPDVQDPSADALFAMPWEYLISVGTRAVGRVDPILITRLWPTRDVPPGKKPHRLMMIESAPGRVADRYDFDSEWDRVRAALGGDQLDAKRVRTSRLERCKRLIAEEQPNLLHISGVDNHQAPSLLEVPFQDIRDAIDTDAPPPTPLDATSKAGPLDGMLMCGRGAAEIPVAYTDVASMIEGLKTAPVVTLNLYYSGCRIAAEFVRKGARAALGFFDEVDDELAEVFLQELFWELRELPDLDHVPFAFDRAWSRVMEGGHDLHGTGIVLWTASSMFPHVAREIEKRHEERERQPSAPRRKAISIHTDPVSQLLSVDLEVPETLNYSLLHNERPLLNKLTLTKLVHGVLDDVSVLVELSTGEQTYPYRCTQVELAQPQLALADKVVIPLTAELLRSLREVVQTTVYVRVMVGQRIAHEETRRTKLLPIDQWLDDTTNNPWLPSFVLARDQAVARIVSSARKYLIALQDDPNAGFDGYQSVVEAEMDSYQVVDLQVHALWTAILNDYRLMYVPPPPAYASANQRLRTPSEVIATSSGTCIDLALLLAACIEYVEIFPVIVLLSGHAFVGFWRSEQGHDAFRMLADVPARYTVQVGPVSRASIVPLVDARSWRLSPQCFDELRDDLRQHELSFLEATGLCFGYSFAEALKEGAANLRARSEFDSLLDIRLARLAQPAVTPLPVVAAHHAAGPQGEPK